MTTAAKNKFSFYAGTRHYQISLYLALCTFVWEKKLERVVGINLYRKSIVQEAVADSLFRPGVKAEPGGRSYWTETSMKWLNLLQEGRQTYCFYLADTSHLYYML